MEWLRVAEDLGLGKGSDIRKKLLGQGYKLIDGAMYEGAPTIKVELYARDSKFVVIAWAEVWIEAEVIGDSPDPGYGTRLYGPALGYWELEEGEDVDWNEWFLRANDNWEKIRTKEFALYRDWDKLSEEEKDKIGKQMLDSGHIEDMAEAEEEYTEHKSFWGYKIGR
jgi:hypothetical protein